MRPISYVPGDKRSGRIPLSLLTVIFIGEILITFLCFSNLIDPKFYIWKFLPKLRGINPLTAWVDLMGIFAIFVFLIETGVFIYYELNGKRAISSMFDPSLPKRMSMSRFVYSSVVMTVASVSAILFVMDDAAANQLGFHGLLAGPCAMIGLYGCTFFVLPQIYYLIFDPYDDRKRGQERPR